jgi:hypothetical protein
MNLVKALNAISSQVWAVALILIGVGCFGIACICRASDVRSALVEAAIGMIGGAIAMFQHQPAGKTDSELHPAIDPQQPLTQLKPPA